MEVKKKTPERMCVLCRKMKPKKSMVRIVSDDNGVTVDLEGKKNGRGAYVCGDADCVKKCGNKKLLSKMFKFECTDEFTQRLTDALRIKNGESQKD